MVLVVDALAVVDVGALQIAGELLVVGPESATKFQK